jgi:hypothetical protein
MTPTIKALATFLPDGKSYVTELPTMEKPKPYNHKKFCKDAEYANQYQHEVDVWHDHLRRLPRYDFPTCLPEQDGQTVEVRLQHQVLNMSKTTWRDCEISLYEMADPSYRRIIALPASTAEQEKGAIISTSPNEAAFLRRVLDLYRKTGGNVIVTPTSGNDDAAREAKPTQAKVKTLAEVVRQNFTVHVKAGVERRMKECGIKTSSDKMKQLFTLLDDMTLESFEASTLRTYPELAGAAASQQGEVERLKEAHYAGWYNGMVNAYKHEFSWEQFKNANNL